jgi:aspartyl protease family protein
MFDGMDEVCPPCLTPRRKKRVRRRVVMSAVLFVLACVAVTYAGYRVRTAPQLPPAVTVDKGAYSAELKRLEAQLAAEPCDRAKIVTYGDTLIQVGDYRGALRSNEAFFQKCGPYPHLLSITYTAHKLLSEFDAAVADATKLIEGDPADKDYWAWRGLAYEEKGDVANAAADYRQAITLQPGLVSLPINLANMYERSGRPCEAMFALEEYFLQYPELRHDEHLRSRQQLLTKSGKCEELSGKGRAVVSFSRATGAIIAPVRLNGREQARMVVDTGASFVTLSRKLASRLGFPENVGTRIFVQTAGGVQPARLTVVDQIELQGARATRVEVAISDGLPEGVDGLLGLSFLSRFEVTLHSAEGRLEVAAHHP